MDTAPLEVMEVALFILRFGLAPAVSYQLLVTGAAMTAWIIMQKTCYISNDKWTNFEPIPTGSSSVIHSTNQNISWLEQNGLLLKFQLLKCTRHCLHGPWQVRASVRWPLVISDIKYRIFAAWSPIRLLSQMHQCQVCSTVNFSKGKEKLQLCHAIFKACFGIRH